MGILREFQTHSRLQKLLVLAILLALCGFLYKRPDFPQHKTEPHAHPDVTNTSSKVGELKTESHAHPDVNNTSSKVGELKTEPHAHPDVNNTTSKAVTPEKLESLPGKSPSSLTGDVLRITTNTGIQAERALDLPNLSFEFPFTSFYATLNVSTGPDVVDVTIFRFNTRISNCSIGIGNTQFSIKLWKSKTSVKQIINIHFTRSERPITYDAKSEVEECYLEQDCDLIIYPERKCGPQAMEDWRPSVGIQGYWLLKCNDCIQSQTCLWPQAKWVESSGEVTPPTLPDGDHLRACFQNQQLLFLGDSTLRAIMRTMMERVNRTLHNTVDSMATTNYINTGLGTNFSLTYNNPYLSPLPPTAPFNFMLNKFPKIFSIKGKEMKTILVVGGTQWLRKSHMEDVNKFITKAGIPSKNVFVKLFSSAFRIAGSNTKGEYMLPPQMLMKLNGEVREAAIKYGFEFVDPMQLTLSRYTEFHEGPCACHFHAIKSYEETLERNLTSKQAPPKYPRTLFHVTGDLNIVYTHILLKKMCPQSYN